MNNQNIVSPCISICKTDPISGFCYGCGRSNEDKATWKNEETSNTWKENNLLEIRDRLKGWQKIAFEESYSHKKEKGISLIKQKFMESKNS
tara:strand:- start:56 stop:328 length:273 start_codon:yes stop_codon:yes gene_type:complete